LSEGEYDNGKGEQQDLKAVVDWAVSEYGIDQITGSWNPHSKRGCLR
jgi:alpha/beta superfamily hydrolase